jgi:hypothetical protein
MPKKLIKSMRYSSKNYSSNETQFLGGKKLNNISIALRY